MSKTITDPADKDRTNESAVPIWYKIIQNLTFAAILYIKIFTNTMNKSQ